MKIWIKPDLLPTRGGAAGDRPEASLPDRIGAALRTGRLSCAGGGVSFLAAPVAGAQGLIVLDRPPEVLPDAVIVLGTPDLPVPDRRRPPLWFEQRPAGSDAAGALWELSLGLHDRRLGPDVTGQDQPRPWISGAAAREAALVLPDGRTIVLRDDAARDPPRLNGAKVTVVGLAGADRAGLLAALDGWRPGMAAAPAGSGHRVRLAFVLRPGDDPDRLRALARKLVETAKGRVTHPAGLVFNPEARRDPVAFLFPGQGAQYRGMLRASLAAHPNLRDWFDALDRHYPVDLAPLPSRLLLEDWAPDSPMAQAFHGLAGGGYASLTAALAHHDMLIGMGLHPDAMLGHSNGENAALIASGVIRTATRRGQFSVLSHMSALFSRADASFGDGATAGCAADRPVCMALVLPASMDAAVLDDVLDDTVLLMMDNCPSQKVVWGPAHVLDQRLAPLRKEGLLALRLPIGAPYHTPHFAPVVARFLSDYGLLDLGPARVPLYSGHTGAPFAETRDAIIATATRQWSEPVRFGRAIERMHRDGIRVFIDVGPGGRLAGFVRDTLGAAPHSALAVDEESRPDGTSLPRMLAQVFALGLIDKIATDDDIARTEAAGIPPAAMTALAIPRDAATRADAVVSPVLPTVPSVAPAAGADLSPEPPSERTATIAPQPAPGAAVRAALVTAHFDLMRAHLEGQTRIFAALADRLSDPERRRPSQLAAAPVVQPAAPPPAPDLLRHFGATRVDIRDGCLTATLILDRENQPFLDDHAFCKARSIDPARTGLPVLPLMMSAEIAAAGAVQLAGAGWVVSRIDALRGMRWIASDSGRIELRLDLQPRPEADAQSRRFAASLHHPNAQDDSDGVAATCEIVLARAYHAPPRPLPDRLPPPPATYPDGSPMITGPDFAARLFHGPCFTSIAAVAGWSDTAIEVAVTAPSEDRFLATGTDAPRVIHGPLLDNAGQILALHHKHATTGSFGLFPVFVEAILFFAPKPAAGTGLRVVTRQTATGSTLTGDLDYRDGDGRVVIRVEGMKMVFIPWPRRFEASFFRGREGGSLAVPVAAPAGISVRMIPGFERGFLTTSNRIWVRSLAMACLSDTERAAFQTLPPRGPRQEEWLLGRIAVKEAGLGSLSDPLVADLAELRVDQDAGGRPSLVLPTGAQLPCSISHSTGAAIGAVAPPGIAVGIDIEPVAGPDDPFARNALAFGAAEADAIAAHGPKTVWCAKEAVAKALGTGLMGAPTRFRAGLRGTSLTVTVASTEIPVSILQADGHHVVLCYLPQAEARHIATRLADQSLCDQGLGEQGLAHHDTTQTEKGMSHADCSDHRR